MGRGFKAQMGTVMLHRKESKLPEGKELRLSWLCYIIAHWLEWRNTLFAFIYLVSYLLYIQVAVQGKVLSSVNDGGRIQLTIWTDRELQGRLQPICFRCWLAIGMNLLSGRIHFCPLKRELWYRIPAGQINLKNQVMHSKGVGREDRNIGEKNPIKLTWGSIQKLQSHRVPWFILPTFVLWTLF